MMRAVYALIGAIIGATIDLAINLLAAIVQARTPADQFRQLPVGWMIGFIIVGLLAGLWHGKELISDDGGNLSIAMLA